MRFIRRLLVTCVFILFGYWLAISNILHDTIIEEGIHTILKPLSIERDRLNTLIPHVNSNNTVHIDTAIPSESDTPFDYIAMQRDIIQKTNDLRASLNISPLNSNEHLQSGAFMRAQETIQSFSHTRPNGQNPFTVFSDSHHPPNYSYQVIGENLAMTTFDYLTQDDVVDIIFDGWVNSPGHYENMINAHFTEIGVGIASDGNAIYITQLFGHPQ